MTKAGQYLIDNFTLKELQEMPKSVLIMIMENMDEYHENINLEYLKTQSI